MIPASPRAFARFALCVLPFSGLGAADEPGSRAAPSIAVLRCPGPGLQPSVAAAPDGTLHAVWFTGDPARGQLRHARSAPGTTTWEPGGEIRHASGLPTALGTIRGPRLSASGDALHVSWLGAPSAESGHGLALYHTVSRDGGRSFDPERDLTQGRGGLDAGGLVTAAGDGAVWAVWQDGQPGQAESERILRVAPSTDGGRTFEEARPAREDARGVCPCCALAAIALPGGQLAILYRGLDGPEHRPMVLLRGHPRDGFAATTIEDWPVAACPMSDAALANAAEDLIGAWETDGRIGLARWSPDGTTRFRTRIPEGRERQRYPAVAADPAGRILVAWTEGTGWGRGGAVCWQLFSAHGEPLPETGRSEDLTAWNRPAVAARSHGQFVVVY